MEPSPESTKLSRLGFHYAADNLHYRERDLQIWLPELQKLGASWLTLQAPAERAVPEYFLNGLLAANIQPILQFDIPVAMLRPGDGLQLLFNHYARLGVQYVVLYDRPNLRKSWAASMWAQSDLVERFLDQYLPLADLAVLEGLTPVFPPLEPGGDFWDLAFLSAALESMQRRGCWRVLDALTLGVYAQAGNRPLAWGAGGAQRWPGARPYAQQPGMQDQRGFLTYEWYLDICQKVLGRRMPVILFKAGSQIGDCQDGQYDKVDAASHASRNQALIEWLHGERIIFGLDARPAEEVLACNFWLLQAERDQAEYKQAWFHPGGRNLAVVTEVYRWAASRRGELIVEESYSSPLDDTILAEPLAENEEPVEAPAPAAKTHHSIAKGILPSQDMTPISHYVLLPLYAWGMADWDMDLILPLLQEAHPTIGFSLAEARMAQRVTVVGGKEAISEKAIETLHQAGCVVERLASDGTLVAT